MSNILVTGGGGFIGRWIVNKLLEQNESVWVLDDLSNGSENNLRDFQENSNFKGLHTGKVQDKDFVKKIFKNGFGTCIHLAAQINVQESIDHPKKSYDSNILGTYILLEEARKKNVKFVLVGTCMVYDLADTNDAIDEKHPVKPLSPYAASKLAAENLAESYYHSYGLPVVITRPFNTYGPFQKSNMEGGVVNIFIKNKLHGETLNIFGDGTQTRDLLYVEDCANFLVSASFEDKAVGEIINAGLGEDISINDLAYLIVGDKDRIVHIKHHHPQAEIKKLLCDYSKAERLLNWRPKFSLEEGIEKTEGWIRDRYSKKN